MTLTKAIEAARKALTGSVEWVGWQTFDHDRHKSMMKVRDNVDKALAALPDKPMTETEIYVLMIKAYDTRSFHKVIRALKDANVLYVEED